MSEINTYQHKDLLNRLSEMQRVPYYAIACHDLVKAEMAIVSLEQERYDLRAALAERDAIAKDNDKAHALLRQSLDALEAALSDDQPYIQQSKDAVTAIKEFL